MEAPGLPNMTYEQEKEEKLKLAREKLKQFRQRKKEAEAHSSPSPVDNAVPEAIVPPSGQFYPPAASEHPHSRSVSVASSSISGYPERSTPTSAPAAPLIPESEEMRMQYEIYCQTLSNQVSSLQETISSSSIAHREEMDKIKSSYEDRIQDLSNSVQICVSEKSELSLNLNASQKEVCELKEEIQSLDNRLREALSSSEGQFEDAKKLGLKEEEVRALQKDMNDVNGTVINQKHEISEIMSKLKSKSELADDFENKYLETRSQLEMAELNLSQMRNGNPDELLAEKNEEISKLQNEQEAQEKRISELTAYIQQSNAERDQIINQYTSYSQQLVAQIEALNKTLTQKLEENSKLSESERSLLSTVLNLENRLQELMNLQTEAEKPAVSPSDEENASELRTRLGELQVAHDQLFEEKGLLVVQADTQESRIQELSMSLEENLLKISSMETEMEMLRSNFETAPINSNLMESMESDKVAASRAVSQNQELKKQLEELQTALVNLTNAKAGLMNELEDMKRKNVFLSKCANESEGVKAIFEEKNRTIKTLSDQLKILLHQQEQQKLRETSEEGGAKQKDNESEIQQISVEKEDLVSRLKAAQDQISNLEAHNLDLKNQLSSSSAREEAPVVVMENTPPSSVSSDGSYVHVDIPDDPSEDKDKEEEAIVEEEEDMSLASSSSTTCSHSASEENSNKQVVVAKESIPSMEMDVAHFKLQQKFHDAMKKIADLMNEKDYLEHIVVQLQEETETVGEYITLYQYQRSMQKKNLEEKERQLQKVCRDREDLLSKLDKLQKLLSHFVENKETSEGIINPGEGRDRQRMTLASNEAPEKPLPPPIPHSAVPFTYSEPDVSLESKETANKILSLLNEIGSNSALKDEFRPWFWGTEAGQLITI